MFFRFEFCICAHGCRLFMERYSARLPADCFQVRYINVYMIYRATWVFLTRIAAILWVCASKCVCLPPAVESDPRCSQSLCVVLFWTAFNFPKRFVSEFQQEPSELQAETCTQTRHRLQRIGTFEESLQESCVILWISQLWDVGAVVWVVIFLKGGGANRPFCFDLHSLSLKNLW